MTLSPKTLLDQAWEIYKKRFVVFLGIVALPVFVSSLLAAFFILMIIWLRSGSLSVPAFFLSPFGLGLMLSLFFVSFAGELWSQTALLCAIRDRGENIGIKESYRRGWGKITSYFWISFLSGFIIAGGTFLFFVPGLIFFVWFSLASFVFISENKKGWSALMASKGYVRGNWRGVFWRFLFIGIIIWLFFYLLNVVSGLITILDIGDILFCVGYLLLIPIVTTYLFLIYENLRKIKADSSVYQELEQKK